MVEYIKLLDVLEANIDEISGQWAAAVKKNRRTPIIRMCPTRGWCCRRLNFTAS